MTGNSRSPISDNYNQWSAIQFFEPEITSTTFAETIQEPKKIFLIDGITMDGFFNLFSIFFASTVALIFALILASLATTNHSNYTNLMAILVSIFVTGYTTIFAIIFMFYTIRFSKFFRALYQNYSREIKMLTFLSIIIFASTIFSLFAQSEETITKITGYAGLAIIGVVIVVTQKILHNLASPYTRKISDWLGLVNEE
jgi:hypothetical protein